MYLVELYWTAVALLVITLLLFRWPRVTDRPRLSHYVCIGMMAGLSLVVITVPAYVVLAPH